MSGGGAELFREALDELIYFGGWLHVGAHLVSFPGRHEVCPVRRLAACADGWATERRWPSRGRDVACRAPVLEVAQGVNGELRVTDGNEVAGRAADVHDVVGALEPHLGAGVRQELLAVHVVGGHIRVWKLSMLQVTSSTCCR